MLKLVGVHAYYGKAHILNGVELSVGQGEVVALLGRNGAGKSTTMKSIMGIVGVREGEIWFDGARIERLASHVIAKRGLGYVPEDRRVFPDLTVAENLEVGRQELRAGAPQWTLDELFELFPNLDERKANLGKQLSGGEQQMLTIARTLMGNPSLVLLDEPSEGLAPRIVEQMARTIAKLKSAGLTILLSEQNLHFARLVADKACIIEKGEKVFEGTMRELEENEAVRNAHLSV